MQYLSWELLDGPDYINVSLIPNMSGAGKNADQINISLPKDAAVEIKRRATAMGLSTSRYCFMILKRHLREGAPLVLSEDQAPYSEEK